MHKGQRTAYRNWIPPSTMDSRNRTAHQAWDCIYLQSHVTGPPLLFPDICSQWVRLRHLVCAFLVTGKTTVCSWPHVVGCRHMWSPYEGRAQYTCLSVQLNMLPVESWGPADSTIVPIWLLSSLSASMFPRDAPSVLSVSLCFSTTVGLWNVRVPQGISSKYVGGEMSFALHICKLSHSTSGVKNEVGWFLSSYSPNLILKAGYSSSFLLQALFQRLWHGALLEFVHLLNILDKTLLQSCLNRSWKIDSFIFLYSAMGSLTQALTILSKCSTTEPHSSPALSGLIHPRQSQCVMKKYPSQRCLGPDMRTLWGLGKPKVKVVKPKAKWIKTSE